MEYSIVFSSRTGNTKMLADALRGFLPTDGCAYFGGPEHADPTTPMVYVGFWTDKGTADKTSLSYIQSLRGKKVFLFGTAGFGGSQAYFEKIIESVRGSLDKSNSLIGWYMCQGKMPSSVRVRYEAMKNQPEPPANIQMLIKNYDEALSHPNAADIEKLKKAVMQGSLCSEAQWRDR